MALSSSEDRAIVDKVVVTQYGRVTDGQTDTDGQRDGRTDGFVTAGTAPT